MVKRNFPVFREAAEWTLVLFWKNHFLQCADGKFPSGFTVSKDIIYVKKGTKTFKYEMPKDAQGVFIQCKVIFEEVLGIKADEEKQHDMQEFTKFQEQNTINLDSKEITTIKDVRKKEDKLKLIDEFVLGVGIKLNLSLFQKQKLKTAILAGMDLKIITEFEFKDNKITHISGISFSKTRTGFKLKLLVKEK